jgi:histidine triad (HIT) family protein
MAGQNENGREREEGAVECRFCRVVSGSLPALVVYQDAQLLAFLDHRPLFPGHVLLVPREHHQTLPELPAHLVAPLFLKAQLLARAVEVALEAEGSFLALNNRVSQSVPHLHVHIIPRRYHDGLKGFFWPRVGYRDEEHQLTTARLIRAAAQRLELAGLGALPG